MISTSLKSKRTFNPIRNIVDNLNPPKDHCLKLINLALGDPTLHGNLKCPQVLTNAVQECLLNHSAHGYLPSTGLLDAKKAIAHYYSTENYKISEDDIVIASGCSGTVELVLSALIDEGQNILVPKPAFPLYQVITQSLGGYVKHYPLKPDDRWECDLEKMNELVDANTRAIVINNPSNPCGSNFSIEHLYEIAKIARKHNLLIIADEIYGGCVFNGNFHPFHKFSGDVPVITLGGLAKQFVVPGWRVGWLIMHDKDTGRLQEVKKGIKSLTQIVLGATSLIQGAIPRILTREVDSMEYRSIEKFSMEYKAILQDNVKLCKQLLKDIIALNVIEPYGTIYMMVKINLNLFNPQSISNDQDFAMRLLQEENLFLLPGQCFNMNGFIRLVICCTGEIIIDACNRLKSFCSRHTQQQQQQYNDEDKSFNGDEEVISVI